MTAEPAAITGQRKSVPPAVEEAVLTALEKLPADRWGTAAEFAAALAGGGSGGSAGRGGRTAALPAASSLSASTARLTYVALAVTAALAAWGWLRPRAIAGPTIYDAALPDSAPMSFGAATSTTTYGASFRNIAISAGGDFVIYAARRDTTTSLWYRSLRTAETHAVGGTTGGTAPRISPDGKRIAFFVGDQLMIVPLAGGEPRRALEGLQAMSVDWVSPNQLLVLDHDGYRANWIDPDGGTARSREIPRCLLGRWEPSLRLLICNAFRSATLVDPETGQRWPIRSVRPDGSTGPVLSGSAFRIVGDRYLVYVAPDGILHGARYDPATHLVRWSVPLVEGIRREGLGEGQFDIALDGLLVYGPGADASIGRLVILRPGAAPVPLPVPPADFQRFDLSPDRRWLAAAVEVSDGHEFRIYDLRNGQQFAWLRAEHVRHPLWSPDGQRLLAAIGDTTRWVVIAGSPSSGAHPDTLAVVPNTPSEPDPIDFQGEHLALAEDWGGSIVLKFDPAQPHATFDTVLSGVRFPSLSPSGKLLLYQALDGSRIIVTAFPKPGRQFQIATEGAEPLWLSPSEVLFRSGVKWYLARVNPETGEPGGAPAFWGSDPRFSDTSGWSNRPSRDGGIIYVEGPGETTTRYLRVVPSWVTRMKAAVDSANR
jgi:hypothetical protein